MSFKKFLILVPLYSAVGFAAESPKSPYPGLNSTEVGIQNVSYKETLKDFAGIGDLSTDISVNNTVVYASSYTNISENWGFMLNTQSSATSEFTKDEWTIAGFDGAVQKNTSKLGVNDLIASGVYHIQREVYATFGAQLNTVRFLRSNFEAVEPNASAVNEAIRVSDQYFTDPNPPQITSNPLAAVEEDLTFVNGVLGIYYNTAFSAQKRPLTWRAGASLSMPMYVSAKNSALEQQYQIESIEDSFNGYALKLNAGLSYEFTKGLAVTLNADYMISEYDEINTKFMEDVGGQQIERTAAIPDIEMSSMQFTLGLLWIN